MKKVILFLTAILMCFIMGCNGDKQIMNSNVNGENTVQTQEVDKIGIVDASSFYGGVAVITASDGKKYAIDSKGSRLFDVGSNDTDIVFFAETASVENYLIDKQGKIIASPENNHYTGLLTEFVDGYAIAYYYEEGYPSSNIKIGVLNSQGDWHVPLTENHKILQELGVETSLEIFGNIKIEALWFVADTSNLLSTTFAYGNSSKITYTGRYKGNGIFEIGGVYYSAAQDLILNDYKEATTKYENSNENFTSYKKYIYAGTTVVESDGYTYRHMLNDNGITYYCVFDADGKQMFEPRKYIDNDKCVCIDKEGFVYKTGDGFVLFDINGNEICKYENIKTMSPFYEGVARVTDPQGMVRFIDRKGNTIIE